MESRPLSAMGRAIERLKVKKNIAAFKPYKCTECNDVFTNKSLLTRNLESVHKEKKPCDCRICGKSFVSNQTLIEHISAVHEGKKLQVQSVCKYFFPISEFSYFVIRFFNHIFFVINFSCFVIRFYYRAIK